MARNRKSEFAERVRQIRKVMPPPGRIINPKKMYNRRDKSWMDYGGERWTLN